MKKYQVLSGCYPFLYLPSILFYSGENLFFYSGEVFKISLASFSLRSLFYGLQKFQILTASAPLQADFSRLPLGFVLTVRSQLIFAFSLCSLSVRSSVRLLFVEKIKVKREVNIKVNFKVIKGKIKVIKIEVYRHWMYTKKVDKCVRIRDKKKQKGKAHMSNKNSPAKYSEELKKTIVTLYQSGKTYAEIKKEYGVSSSALSNWVRKYSQVQVDEDTVLTAQQIKALQRRNAELEEENLILKKAIAIFTPHSDRD